MFEMLFKYPPAIFSRGKFVLLSSWPVWLLPVLIVAAAAGLYWHIHRSETVLSRLRSLGIWAAQTALVALVLFMLWHPAISVARLRPQQNVVAVLMDHSRSMALADDGKVRIQVASDLLNNELLPELSKKFQVRQYEFGKDAVRVDQLKNVSPQDNATRIGDSLKHIAAEAGTMPLGAIVLMTDGGDNTGGVDRETIAQLRQLRVPVHTIGFGPDHFNKDVELEDVALPARTMKNSRLVARVAFKQHGYENQAARLVVREDGRPLAQQEFTIKGDIQQSQTVIFNAGDEGAHSYTVGIEPLNGEENARNNAMVRVVNVTRGRRRILYVEGEPRWEYKFIRRALEDDESVEFVSVVRTTQNKTYQQGGKNGELENGFPTSIESLFTYDGLIIGSVEANYLSNAQLNMVRDFADRRGGGVLFLAGRFALNESGWASTPVAEMLPLRLPGEKTWSRDFAEAQLTDAGRESVITRLEEGRDANLARWKKMPLLANYAALGTPKPGAVVLMNVVPPGKRPMPLLTIQNYGHGRTGILATAGTWRWKMQQDHADKTHAYFWQQLMRWLVAETPGQVTGTTPRQVLSDETHISFRTVVRDKTYQTVAGATAQALITQPDGNVATVDLKPDPLEPGAYSGDFNAEKPGAYVAELVAKDDKGEIGRDSLTFRREDGVAENFNAAQNKELLEKLSADTNGNYYTPSKAKRLAEEATVSEAGITAHDNLDLWDMPILFLLAILLRGGEWLLRRKWGVV